MLWNPGRMMKTPIRNLICLLLLPSLTLSLAMKLWAVTKTWPMPMPVHANSTVLPHFFSTSCEGEIPCATAFGEDPKPFNQSNFHLLGTLCFSFHGFMPCIRLQHANLSAWLEPQQIVNPKIDLGTGASAAAVPLQSISISLDGKQHVPNVTASTTVFTYMITSQTVIPFRNNVTCKNATQFRAAPWCTPAYSFPPTFRDCQSRESSNSQLSLGFQFSPPLDRFILSHKGNESGIAGWPWFQWILSNEAKATTDLSAFSSFRQVNHELWNVTALLKTAGTENQAFKLTNITYHQKLFNHSFKASPICTRPPFFFLLADSNDTENLNCMSTSCFLAECWNGSQSLALIVRLPTFVPIPVEADPEKFPIMNLIRQERDFGITAAIITAITVSAAAAATAAVAMAHQVQTAETINQVVEKTATALVTQEKFNAHVLSGMRLVNQRMDLIQEQMNELYQLIQTSCISHYQHVCVTPLSYNFAVSTKQSRIISDYLAGNWTLEAERLSRQLVFQIAQLNGTRAEIVTFGDFTSWLHSAFSYFKEWIGVGMFGICLLAGLFLCLWLLCRFKKQQYLKNQAVIQAMLAVEQGTSPQVWLSMLNR